MLSRLLKMIGIAKKAVKSNQTVNCQITLALCFRFICAPPVMNGYAGVRSKLCTIPLSNEVCS